MGWAIGAAAAVVVIAAAALLGAAYYFSNRVLLIRTRTKEDIVQQELERGTIGEKRLAALERAETFELQTHDGHMLQARFLPADGGETSRTVVFAHGVTQSMYGMLKYADLFLARGFNALMYDHRRHGRSGGPYTTYGFHEKRDLAAAFDWAANRGGPNAVIGVFGESMGAATVLQFAALDARPAFIAVDCPFSDLRGQLAHVLRQDYPRLPHFPLLALTSMWCRLRAGFRLRDVSPVRGIGRLRAPLFIAHGLDDDYVPTAMSQTLYEQATGAEKKLLHLTPKAAHAGSLAAGRAAYERKLEEFLSSCGMMPYREATRRGS